MVGEHVRMPDTRVCTHTHTLAPRSQSFQLCSPRFLIKWGIWWLEGDGGTCRQITVCLSSPLSTYTHCPLVLSPNQLLQVFPEVEKYILTFFFPFPLWKPHRWTAEGTWIMFITGVEGWVHVWRPPHVGPGGWGWYRECCGVPRGPVACRGWGACICTGGVGWIAQTKVSSRGLSDWPEVSGSDVSAVKS